VVPAAGNALYYAEDSLGSSRVIVQSAGTLCYDADFTPFGGERSYTSTCAQNYKFEGKERDTETGNDDFGARYYTWRFGRWLSSDWSALPVPVPYANLGNPQTLNLYSMVADDPESFADLDGHMFWAPYLSSVSNPVDISAMVGDAAGPSELSAGLNYFGNADPQGGQNQNQAQSSAAQNTGEGSQANLDRRQGIADAATDAKQRADLGQKQYGPNQCSALVAACISKAGADAKFTPNDGPARPPVAGEWANKKADIPGWRVLGPKEKPEPGDVAAVHIMNPHFAATGDSAIVVRRGNGLSAIQAGDHGVEYNSNFIRGYEGVVYRRYTGD
jgi:RHS repeat-associated protein